MIKRVGISADFTYGGLPKFIALGNESEDSQEMPANFTGLTNAMTQDIKRERDTGREADRKQEVPKIKPMLSLYSLMVSIPS